MRSWCFGCSRRSQEASWRALRPRWLGPWRAWWPKFPQLRLYFSSMRYIITCSSGTYFCIFIFIQSTIYFIISVGCCSNSHYGCSERRIYSSINNDTIVTFFKSTISSSESVQRSFEHLWKGRHWGFVRGSGASNSEGHWQWGCAVRFIWNYSELVKLVSYIDTFKCHIGISDWNSNLIIYG